MPELPFLIKLQAPSASLLKKETLAQVLSCEFCEIFKNTFFLQNTSRSCFCLSLTLDFLLKETFKGHSHANVNMFQPVITLL